MKPIILIENPSHKAKLDAAFKSLGLWGAWTQSAAHGQLAFSVDAHSQQVSEDELQRLPGVQGVFWPQSKHPKLDAQRGQGVQITSNLAIGGENPPVLAAGPCSAEGPEQLMEIAALARAQGARLLRGGAFKPRTSPYAFDGHGEKALHWLRDAADAHDLAVVTEVMSEMHIPAVGESADLLQIGSRNMQNFSLLRRVGQVGKPVLLKRGRAASLSEWRMAAEYLLDGGASGVIFCERGILGSDPETRNTLDLASVALLKHVDQLAVIVDPSHACGRRDLILPLSKAALAAGADGLLIETHLDAGQAKSDGAQALSADEFESLGAFFQSQIGAA